MAIDEHHRRARHTELTANVSSASIGGGERKMPSMGTPMAENVGQSGNLHFISCADLVPALIERCASVINGIAMSQDIDFHTIFWHPKTMGMIVQINETREALKAYNKAWRSKTRGQAGVKVCAILASVEILNGEMFSWSDSYPAATAIAKGLLQNAEPLIQRKILTIFRIVDNDEMGEEWQRVVANALTNGPA